MNPVLIIGCGDIGVRVASRLAPTAVTGVVKSAPSAERLRALGIEVVQRDLDASSTALELPVQGRQVYYFAPPPPHGELDTRVARVCAAWLGDELPARVVYISTSAVYGDCAGAWIDETAPLRPGTARGRRRLDAESRWLRWSRQTGVAVVLLRVPGIYACDRLPAKRLRAGLPVLAATESPFTNRIHAEDLAQACILAMQRGAAGVAYNVSDGQPTTMTDYFNRVAERLHLPRPPVLDREAAREALSASMWSFLSESKRLDNRRMLEQLGIHLQYPHLAAGLAACEGDDP